MMVVLGHLNLQTVLTVALLNVHQDALLQRVRLCVALYVRLLVADVPPVVLQDVQCLVGALILVKMVLISRGVH